MKITDKEKLYLYLKTKPFGKEIFNQNVISYQNLLLLVPNNIKKYYHLPLRRNQGKKRIKYKNNIRRMCARISIEKMIQTKIKKGW